MGEKRVPTTAQVFMGPMRGFLAVAAAHESVAAVCDRRPQRPPRRSYRLAVPARLPNNQPLLDTLPKLTPQGGHTPDAVNASAAFVAPNQFRVVYDASTDAGNERGSTPMTITRPAA